MGARDGPTWLGTCVPARGWEPHCSGLTRTLDNEVQGPSLSEQDLSLGAPEELCSGGALFWGSPIPGEDPVP